MSRQLMEDFFKRDLSAPEMDEIARSLESDDDEAAFFALLTAGHYAALGLPRPKFGRGGPGLGTFTGFALIAGALIAGACWWASKVPKAAVEPTSASSLATAPLSTPILPVTTRHYLEGDALNLEVDLPRSLTLTVDVFDSTGRRVRRIFEGPAGPGKLDYGFDGRDYKGNQVKPGKYQVVVDYGAGKIDKWLTIGEVGK